MGSISARHTTDKLRAPEIEDGREWYYLSSHTSVYAFGRHWGNGIENGIRATTATSADGDMLPPTYNAKAFLVSERAILECGNKIRAFATHLYTQVFGICRTATATVWHNVRAAVPADAFPKHLLW